MQVEEHPQTPYLRTPLPSEGDSHELLALRWQREVRCAPHDHGGAAGTIHLVEGRLIERRFEFRRGKLSVLQTVTYEAPAIIPVEASLIHDMLAPEGGLSIHRYERSSRGMRVWDVAAQRTLVLAEGAGAWVPRSNELVLSSCSWSDIA